MLFSDSNVVKGVGAVDPLDVLYDCGQDNLIRGMLVMTCNGATASGQRGQMLASNRLPKGITYGK